MRFAFGPTTGGAYSAPSDPYLDFMGRGRERRGREEGNMGGKEGGERGKEGGGREPSAIKKLVTGV